MFPFFTHFSTYLVISFTIYSVGEGERKDAVKEGGRIEVEERVELDVKNVLVRNEVYWEVRNNDDGSRKGRRHGCVG